MARASIDGEGEGATSDGVRRVGRYIGERCYSCLGRDRKEAGKAV